MSQGLIDRVVVTLAGALLGLVAIEILFAPNDHPVFPWHHLPGYPALIGVGSCIVVVLLTKALGKWALQRPESHGD